MYEIWVTTSFHIILLSNIYEDTIFQNACVELGNIFFYNDVYGCLKYKLFRLHTFLLTSS